MDVPHAPSWGPLRHDAGGPGSVHPVPPAQFPDLRAVVRHRIPLLARVRLADPEPGGDAFEAARPRMIREVPRSAPASGGVPRGAVRAALPAPGSHGRVSPSRPAAPRAPAGGPAAGR